MLLGYLRGRSAARARRIWPDSWKLERCHPSGWGGGAGPPRDWCHSGPRRRAGRSLSGRRAWGTRSVYNLSPVSAGLHPGLRQRERSRLWDVGFSLPEIRRPAGSVWLLLLLISSTDKHGFLMHCTCRNSFHIRLGPWTLHRLHTELFIHRVYMERLHSYKKQ